MSHLSKAQDAYARGDLDEAERWAAQAMNESRSAETLAAFSRIVGENGRRADAAGILASVADQYPNDGYLKTLLGEQQVRLGQWGIGTQNIVTGLNIDRSETPRLHAMSVVADLVAAHRSGKVPKESAQTFINGILYNTGNAPEELKAFLAAARRALDAGQTLEDAGADVPPSDELLPGKSIGAPPGPPPARPGPDRSKRKNRRKEMESHGRGNHSVLPMQSHRPARELQVDGIVEHSRTGSVGAGIRMTGRGSKADFGALMARDMELNGRIQETLNPLGLPSWPSDGSIPKLDTIPSLRPALLGFTRADIQAADDLRFTEGSINSEIILERCSHALREASGTGTARPVQLRSADVTKLEVALWDGAIDQMRPVPRLFDDDPEYDWAVLGIGKFLGDVICRNFGGFWHYPRNPEKAYVIAGSKEFPVVELAQKWMHADDKDDVSLESVVREAAAASDEREAAGVFIDVVTGLDSRALALKLSEQWIQFRSHPSDVPMVQVASDIEPAETDAHVIVFYVASRWAPSKARGRNGIGQDAQGRVAVAYDRYTDEFFILGSRKHFALFLDRAELSLTRGHLQKVADLFDAYHCPGVKVVRKSGEDDGPRFEEKNGGADFWLTARGGGQRVRWHIRYRESAPLPWTIEFAT